jgi:threonine/homoserine/homoserine lactone efflux protein
MNTEASIQWLLIFGPLAISPGPANVLFAASGSSFGVRGSIPFWLGTNITCVFQSLVIGFGLGYVISKYPPIIELLKYIGVSVLLYLAYRFFRLSISEAEAIKPLSFREGVVVEIFNAKYLLIPTIMFTQFYSPISDGAQQVLFLTSMLAALTMASNLVWVFGGKVLTAFVMSNNVKKTQGKVFGVMLCTTAIWLAIG